MDNGPSLKEESDVIASTKAEVLEGTDAAERKAEERKGECIEELLTMSAEKGSERSL